MSFNLEIIEKFFTLNYYYPTQRKDIKYRL